MKQMRIKIMLGLGILLCGASAVSAGWRASTNTAGLELKSYPALVVDCGQDYLRKYDGRPMVGSIFQINELKMVYDEPTGLWNFQNALQVSLTNDVDGDGIFNDDVINAFPFSATERFNPELPWFDSRGASSRWFGGLVVAQGDRREPPVIAENGVNDETVIPSMAPRDNWTFFHETYDVNGPYYFHGVWLWNKADFLADGAAGTVSFDTNSLLSVYMQRYWMGFEGLRWIVQDGGQMYLSEITFQGAGQQPYWTNGKQHTLRPDETRWAPYNPQGPYGIRWTVNTNAFADYTFTNVQAVGFYLFKDRFIPAYTGFKWYAFETKAVVERPDRPSLSLDMAEFEGAGHGVPAFYISRCEVPYLLWKDVFRRARSNTYVLEKGSTFDRDGDMGGMDLDDEAHGLEEPVTDITVPDVMAWCNALSREEGFTPCYYTDASFTDPLREVIPPPHMDDPVTNIVVYVDWSANGYRLPTSDEWTLAAGGAPITNGLPLHSTTVAVDADSADTNGLYHVNDNVREMIWNWGDVYTGTTAGVPVVLGGDFRQGAAADYGASGFRIVRREAGLSAPPIRTDTAFDLVEIAPLSTPSLAAPAALVMRDVPGQTVQMADREVSFALWRDVRNWAVTNGYTFDNDGDMGSMDWWGFADIEPAASHAPSEPVTDISAYDAIIWCNALSEKEGRTPAYYTSSAYTEVLRTAFRFRPLMRLDFDRSDATQPYHQIVYTLGSANGYRLPAEAEYTAAANLSQFSGFTTAAQLSNRVWVLETASGTTRPSGTSEVSSSGFYDLFGNVMELGTTASQTYMQECYGTAFIDLAKLMTYSGLPVSERTVPRGWAYPDLGFRIVRPKP